MVYEKPPFIGVLLDIDPEFILGNKGKPEMLAEVGKLPIYLRTNEIAVNYPDGQSAPPTDFFEVHLEVNRRELKFIPCFSH